MKAVAGDQILTRCVLLSEAGCAIPPGSAGIVIDALRGMDQVFEVEFGVVHPGDPEWQESVEIAWVRPDAFEVVS
jgi:hypothetical protein